MGARPIRYIRDLAQPNRPGMMISALSAAFPNSVSAKDLMSEMGLPWRDQPICSFVSLCTDFKNINRGLRSYGWQAVRTGGTPDDHYRLSPVGGG